MKNLWRIILYLAFGITPLSALSQQSKGSRIGVYAGRSYGYYSSGDPFYSINFATQINILGLDYSYRKQKKIFALSSEMIEYSIDDNARQIYSSTASYSLRYFARNNEILEFNVGVLLHILVFNRDLSPDGTHIMTGLVTQCSPGVVIGSKIRISEKSLWSLSLAAEVPVAASEKLVANDMSSMGYAAKTGFLFTYNRKFSASIDLRYHIDQSSTFNASEITTTKMQYSSLLFGIYYNL